MNDENYYKIFKSLEESQQNYDEEQNYGDMNSDNSISQRQLAVDLGFSLGKINYCLKALVEKGLIKVENFCNSNNKKCYVYKITPAGIKEKARLTLRFLRKKEQEYQQLKTQLAELRAEAAKVEGSEVIIK